MDQLGEKSKRRVTIKDVAKAANVSIATVSYVLNNKKGQSIGEETRKKVLQFANLLGYGCNVIAKYLATGKTNIIAVVVKDVCAIAADYYLRLITELSRVLKRSGFDLKICDYDDVMNRNTSCDGYITLALAKRDFYSLADILFVPVVAIDSVFDDLLFYRINDNYKTLCDNAKREFGKKKTILLTHALPNECLCDAKEHFDDIMTVTEPKELFALDADFAYATVSKTIYDCAARSIDIKLESASCALKASAAADAVIKAVRRDIASPEDHAIRV